MALDDPVFSRQSVQQPIHRARVRNLFERSSGLFTDCLVHQGFHQAFHRPRITDFLESFHRSQSHRPISIFYCRDQRLERAVVFQASEGDGRLLAHRPFIIAQGLQERLDGVGSDLHQRLPDRLANDPIIVPKESDELFDDGRAHLPETCHGMVAQSFVIVPQGGQELFDPAIAVTHP